MSPARRAAASLKSRGRRTSETSVGDVPQVARGERPACCGVRPARCPNRLDGVMNAVAGRRVVERRLCDTCGVGIGGGDVFRPRYFAIVAVGALLAAAAVGLAVAT